MHLLEIFALALGLTMDVFSVSVAVGLALPDSTARQRVRLAFHFGLFHFLMPVIGWLAGLAVQEQVVAFDHWIAFGLLSAVGTKMIREWRGEQESFSGDPTRGLTMVVLCIATSIDALALGISAALLHTEIVHVGILLGLSAALMTWVGFGAGARVGHRLQSKAHLIGGIAVISVGVKILIEHLFFQ